MNSNEHHSIKDRVLEKIEHTGVRMHSRAYFALHIGGVIAFAVLALLVTVFIGNFLFFTLRLNGHGELLSLGARGWGIFVRVFPWWLLAADIALCAALVWLVRRFQFGYRTPVLFVFFALILAALAVGFAIDAGTPVNDRLLQDADRGALPPPFDAVYRGARRAPPRGSAYRGTIISVASTSLNMTDPDADSTLTVLLPAQGQDHALPLTVGEAIFVIGSQQSPGLIQAVDIHPINAAGLPPRETRDPS